MKFIADFLECWIAASSWLVYKTSDESCTVKRRRRSSLVGVEWRHLIHVSASAVSAWSSASLSTCDDQEATADCVCSSVRMSDVSGVIRQPCHAGPSRSSAHGRPPLSLSDLLQGVHSVRQSQPPRARQTPASCRQWQRPSVVTSRHHRITSRGRETETQNVT